MFGGLRAYRAGNTPVELPGQHMRALLAYLALHMDRGHARDDLMALIWPEEPQENARAVG